MSTLQLVDGFLLNNRTDQEILPTTTETEMEAATGGLVLTPSSGLLDYVGVFDLKSLYPSTMLTLNLSRETIVDNEADADIIVPDVPLNDNQVSGDRITERDISWEFDDGIGIRFDQQGFLPKYGSMLFSERDAMKQRRSQFDYESSEWVVWDNKQRAIKVMQNSLFGVSDNKYFRLSREGLGGAITAGSRYVTWKGSEIIREMGHDVVYGDTDSVFVQLGNSEEDSIEQAVETGKQIAATLNESMDEVADDFGLPAVHPHFDSDVVHGTERTAFHWEYESTLRRFLQTGKKKRYAGARIWEDGEFLNEPSYKIKGYETRRSDLPSIGAEVQETVLQRVLDGDSFDEISGYLRAIVTDIREGEISLDRIAIPGSLNKQPEDYPNMPKRRACLYANDHIDGLWWSEGDSPWVCYVKSVPDDKPVTDVIAMPWNVESLPDGFELDVETHIEKFVEGPLEPILDELGWKFSELASGKRTQAIDLSAGPSDDTNPFS